MPLRAQIGAGLFLVTLMVMLFEPGVRRRRDAATRAAVTAFFDTPGVDGRVWLQEARLQYLALRPETMDANLLGTVLRQQSALATALERTAGWRGPSA